MDGWMNEDSDLCNRHTLSHFDIKLMYCNQVCPHLILSHLSHHRSTYKRVWCLQWVETCSAKTFNNQKV